MIFHIDSTEHNAIKAAYHHQSCLSRSKLLIPTTTCPSKLTFTCWGCCSLCPDINQPSLPAPFYFVLVSISVFVALSTVFHSKFLLNNSPLFYPVLPVLWSSFCHIGHFNYISQYKTKKVSLNGWFERVREKKKKTCGIMTCEMNNLEID